MEPYDAAEGKRSRRRRAKTVTLQDVAQHAGVSTATVSRCLNAPQQVNPRLRERVEAAIAELRYVPHGAARALARCRSSLVGAVVPTTSHAMFGDFVYAMEEALFAADYGLLLANSHYDPARELQHVSALISRGVDAMVLVGMDHAPELYERLEASAIPYVHTWVYSPSDAGACVGFDGVEAARRLTSYLCGLGHRHIGMIAGRTTANDRAAQRLQGVHHALAEHGLTLAPKDVIESAFEIGAGRDAMRLLMSRDPHPTAVICGNDILAFGALFECRTLDIDVPGGVSISGFDDHPMAAQVFPPLTTVTVPASEMGRRAAHYLVDTLQQQSTPNHVRLEANLVVRASTGVPDARDSRGRGLPQHRAV